MRQRLGRSICIACVLVCAWAVAVHGMEPALQRADQTALTAANLPPLIPADAFYSTAAASRGHRISPDGGKLLWIAEADGKATVHFAKRGGKATDTLKTERAVRWAYWAQDSRHITVWLDDGGDENFHMFLADTQNPGKGLRDATPYSGATVRFQQNFPDRPSDFLLMDNRRDRSLFDLYRLNVFTGEETLVLENPGNVSRYYTDRSGAVVAIRRQLSGARWSLDVPDSRGWRAIVYGGIEDKLWLEGHPKPGAGWSWAISNLGRDKQVLVKLDLETSSETLIYEDAQADIDSAIIDATTSDLMAVRSMPGHPILKAFNHQFGYVLKHLARDGPFDIRITAWTRDRTALTLTITRDTQATASYLLDRTTGALTHLASPPIMRHARHLSEMMPVRFAARDGLELNGYLTLPKGVRPWKLPLVLRVHGGPFARDRWGYAAGDQFLANRGYAVLRLNYRGSTGFGRAFMRAARKEFARKMQDDLVDGVRWAISRGVADPERVAIYGHSYGGYATLVGLTLTPDVFAAGINVVGVADLATAFRTMPRYWKTSLARWHDYVGRLSDPVDLADMAERSPINHVDRIRKPLLVVHGANDVRVVRAHSDSIVAAARGNGADVQYIVFEDEGHVIRRSANKLTFARAMEQFLARHLGGRAETIGQRKAEAP